MFWLEAPPLSYFPYLESGYVMYTRHRDKDKRFDKKLIIKAAGTHGLSGGPVINRKGKVIGMIHGKPINFDNVLIAVRSSDLKVFLIKNYGK